MNKLDSIGIKYDTCIRSFISLENPSFLDYTTNISYDTYSYLVMDSIDEIYNLENFIESPGKSIQPKAKIFFGDKCTFPSLLLSRLKESAPSLNIKRCTKEDNADNVVIDRPDFNMFRLSDFDDGVLFKLSESLPDGSINNRFYYLQIGNWFSDVTKNNKLDTIKSTVETLSKSATGVEVFYLLGCLNPDKLITTYNNASKSNKITYTDTLIRYVWNFLPKLNEEELQSILSMLKSSDNESIKQGIDLLQYYNYEENIFDVIEALRVQVANISDILNFSVSEKYMNFIIGTSRKELFNTFYKHSYYRSSSYYYAAFYNFYNSISEKSCMCDIKNTSKFIDAFRKVTELHIKENLIPNVLGWRWQDKVEVKILLKDEPNIVTNKNTVLVKSMPKITLDQLVNKLNTCYDFISSLYGMKFAIIDKV